MSRLTKAQLAAENAALRAQVSGLQLDLEIAKSQAAADLVAANQSIARWKAEADVGFQLAHDVADGKAVQVAVLRTKKLPAHMQAAKDMAMRAGIVVKVCSDEHSDFDARR